MSLAEAVRREFSTQDRQRGEAYLRGKRVKLLASTETGCRFSVQGSTRTPYAVNLDWSDLADGVEGECSCPQFEQAGICKHVWAALCTADKLGLTPTSGVPTELNFFQRDDWDDADEENDYYDDHDVDQKPLALIQRMAKGLLNPLFQRMGNRYDQPPAKKKAAGKLAKTPAWLEGVLEEPPRSTRNVTTQRNWEQLGTQKTTRLVYLLNLEETRRHSQVVVDVSVQTQLKNGGWGKLQAHGLLHNHVPALPPEDRELCRALLGQESGSEYEYSYSYGRSYASPSRYRIGADVQAELLPMLCASGRFCIDNVRAKTTATEPITMRWLTDGPLEYRINATAEPRKKQWRLRGEFLLAGEPMKESLPLIIMQHGLCIGYDWIGLWNHYCDFRWLCALSEQEDMIVPFADRQKFLSELWRSGEPPAIVGDAALSLATEVGQPLPRLEVYPNPELPKNAPRFEQARTHELYADVKFAYGERLIAPDSADQAWFDAESPRVKVRNIEREGELLAEISALGVSHRRVDYYSKNKAGNIQFPTKKLSAIVETLVARGWQVSAENALFRRLGEFKQSVTSGVDWFDLETTLDFDGVSASLPQLLAALKQGDKYVTLDDGTRGILPQEWLERVAPLAEFGEVADGKLRFKPSQALLLDALLASREDEVQFECDEHFRSLRAKLQSFSGVKPSVPSETFRGELRPYQQLGLGWLEFLAEHRLGGCLADDMGLGKTVQVLARLEQRRLELLERPEERRPSLAVVPKSLVYNWKLEAEKFSPELKVIDYHGNDRQARCGELTQYDLIVTTYGTMLRDINALRKQPFDYVILDESQAIKNATSQSAKAVRLLDGRHRLAMSGTPVENHLGELWSLFEFLNPGMLGRSEAFRGLGRNGGDPAQMELLRRGIAPFLLRRTKGQVLADLPAKTEQTMYCDLEPAQRKLYNQLRDHYRASLLKTVSTAGIKKSQIQVLEALLRLRQAACHPGLLDPKQLKKPSAKLDTLFEQLDEVVEEGHKVLIFSQFTSLLAIVKQQLDAKKITYEYLDGKTRNRQQKVDRFQTDPQCPLFLISLKAGGVGLNLTAADYVYLLDPWWNPAVEAQAIDRAHRIGQEKPVFAYRLIARDTVEDKILELQTRKRDLADAIIAADGGLVSQMTADDLQLLLS
jgi:superfamily II DNA or RNA helicase